LIPDTRRKPRILTDPSVEGVCEDASDAGGTVTDAGERGTTILAPPLALRRAISHLIDNAVKYGVAQRSAWPSTPVTAIVEGAR
jgi:signal transduction histidine kinase